MAHPRNLRKRMTPSPSPSPRSPATPSSGMLPLCGRRWFAISRWSRDHRQLLRTHLRLLAIVIAAACVAVAQTDIVTAVRVALAQGGIPAAEADVNSYKAQRGDTPELTEAISWIARGALDANQLDLADRYASQTRSLVAAQSKGRPLDAEPHLALALGAAIEVQAQVLAARGQRSKALALLEAAHQRYGATSIRPRIQKNINLLTMTGRPAQPILAREHLGPAP